MPRSSVLLAALLVAVLAWAPATAQTGTPPPGTPASAATPVAGADAAYEDPEGRYTVPIPAGWEAETIDGYGVLRSPEGTIEVALLVVPGDDPLAAIDEAWRRIEPGFDREPVDTLEPPSPPGIEQVAIVTYDRGQESGEILQGVGQVVDGNVFVQLYRGEVSALARRAAQIQIIDSGFNITGVERADLTGVAAQTLTPAMLADLEAYIVATMERMDIPGAAVAVVQDGAVVYEAGFGVRELGGTDPVTPDTLMLIGSTTKPMTTMLMATLVDDGRMDWDTPVVDLLPSFAVADPGITAQMTVRNLVCACTGVPRRDLELVFNSAEMTGGDVVASLARFELFTGFGEAFQYSNQMVATGGYAAAVAAGGAEGSLHEAYVAALQERVLGPIGMTDSTFSFDEAAAGEHATPHGSTLAGGYAPIPLSAEGFLAPIAPAGGLWSNVGDMARYTLTQLERGVAPDGTRVVSEENLRETWQPQVPISADTSYGLGWLIDDYKGLPLIHHGGNTLGFTSDLAFMPDAGLGVVVLANGQGANLFNEAVRYRVLELAFGQEPEYDRQLGFAIEQVERLMAEARESFGDRVDEDAVRPFLGDYASPVLGAVTLRLKPGEADGSPRFVMDAGEFATSLLPVEGAPGSASYATVDPPLVGLPVELRTTDGAPLLVVVDPASGDEYVFERVGAPSATPIAAPMASTPEATPVR